MTTRLLVVSSRLMLNAYTAAIPFYYKNGFVPLNEEDEDEPTRLLYFDLKDLDED